MMRLTQVSRLLDAIEQPHQRSPRFGGQVTQKRWIPTPPGTVVLDRRQRHSLMMPFGLTQSLQRLDVFLSEKLPPLSIGGTL